MDIKNPDFRGLQTEDLKQLARSVELELINRTANSKESIHAQNMETMRSLALSQEKSFSPSQTQQSIASKSEAEIQLRAEKMLASISNQRVVI